MENIKSQQVFEIITAIAECIKENREMLTELDRAIGDGDHGINLSRGFGLAMEKISAQVPIESTVKTLATTLISSVGGASGALYGSFFLKMTGVLKGAEEIDMALYTAMIKEGVEAVKNRGRSEQGEKTMLDTLIPYLEALEGGSTLEEATQKAKEGMESTKDMIATKGRASYLGERSAGHVDPGATSAFLMLEIINNYATEVK